MSRTPLRGVRRVFAVLTATLTIGALATPAAHADGPQVIVTASAGDAKQLVGRSFPVSLSLTNTTDQPYTGVKIWTEHLSGSFVSIQDWAGLGSQDQGVTLDPGATRSFTLTAIVWSWRDGVPSERIHASFSGWDQQPGDYTVPLIDPTTTKGSVSGVVYGDRNDNHQFDPGEGLAGATAYIYGSGDNYQTVTGADGRFTIANVPAQRYGISVHNLPGGWVFDGDSSTMNADVDGSTTPQALLRAVRPLSEQLHATGSFDKRDYQPGDPVQVKFTLTNVGSTALQDLTIGCDRFGSDDHILGWQSWPDLQKFSLAPGETRTFTETGTVPQVSPKFGGFYAACDFGPERGPIDGYPNVNILARVPGPSVPTKGSVFHDDNNNSTQDPGEGIANRFVTLNDVIDGHHIATGRTDADGHVSFASIPAGRYVVRVAGGWVSATPDMFITVGTCGFSCSGDWTLIYKRG